MSDEMRHHHHEGHHTMMRRIGETVFSKVAMGDGYTHHLTGSIHGPVVHYIGTDHNGNPVTGMDYINEDEGCVEWSRIVWMRNSAPHHSYGKAPIES